MRMSIREEDDIVQKPAFIQSSYNPELASHAKESLLIKAAES